MTQSFTELPDKRQQETLCSIVDKSLFLHKFKGVWCCSDEETSRCQTLTGVSQHHVSLLFALKRVMVNKLTAADVKHELRVIQLLRQNILYKQIQRS